LSYASEFAREAADHSSHRRRRNVAYGKRTTIAAGEGRRKIYPWLVRKSKTVLASLWRDGRSVSRLGFHRGFRDSRIDMLLELQGVLWANLCGGFCRRARMSVTTNRAPRHAVRPAVLLVKCFVRSGAQPAKCEASIADARLTEPWHSIAPLNASLESRRALLEAGSMLSSSVFSSGVCAIDFGVAERAQPGLAARVLARKIASRFLQFLNRLSGLRLGAEERYARPETASRSVDRKMADPILAVRGKHNI
jgi:hypothetical protein